MVPPSFVDFALSRDLADGVFLAGCADGDCFYRLGDRWMTERLAGRRDPYLRQRVDRSRVCFAQHRANQSRRWQASIDGFSASLRNQADDASAGESAGE
jgi:coenzyme F420-reducing hydrogenase delta subunit